MNWSHKSISLLGLNSTETGILNVVTEAKSVQHIAIESGISRTGINYSLKKLASKGLISPIRKGRRIYYISITSQELALKLQRTIDDIQIDSPKKKGARIKTSKENEFVIHIGTDEIIPAYRRIASMNKNERIRGLQHDRSQTELANKLSSKQLAEFNQSIITNHLIIDGLLNESAYKVYQGRIKKNPTYYKAVTQSFIERMADYATFPDEFFNHDAELWIFKSTALIINWHEEVAIEITNTNITGLLKDMFEFVKASGRKIDHNKIMREVLKS